MKKIALMILIIIASACTSSIVFALNDVIPTSDTIKDAPPYLDSNGKMQNTASEKYLPADLNDEKAIEASSIEPEAFEDEIDINQTSSDTSTTSFYQENEEYYF